MAYAKLFLTLIVLFVIAVVLTAIEKRQGAIYHCSFWEQVRLNFAVLGIGACLAFLALSND
jgi:hypothetical protein